MFQTHILSVSSVFFCTLQVLHLDVSKVNQYYIWDACGKREGAPRAVWRCEGRPGWHGPATGALARKSDMLGRSLAHCADTVAF
jgi:hypothetical protein